MLIWGETSIFMYPASTSSKSQAQTLFVWQYSTSWIYRCHGSSNVRKAWNLPDFEGDALWHAHANGSPQDAVSTDLPLSTILNHSTKEPWSVTTKQSFPLCIQPIFAWIHALKVPRAHLNGRTLYKKNHTSAWIQIYASILLKEIHCTLTTYFTEPLIFVWSSSWNLYW